MVATTAEKRSGRAQAAKKKSGAKNKTAKKKAAPSRRGAERKGRPKGRAARKAAKQKARLAKLRAREGSRWRIHYDIDGPRVRLGVLWFFCSMVAVGIGPFGLVPFYGVAFAAAAAHTLRTWRARGHDVDPTVALLSTAVVVALAAFGPRFMGLGVLALVGVAVAVSLVSGEEGPRVGLGNVGLVLQCTLPTAVAGGCVVLLADREIWSAISLVLVVSAYESGDFLIGSGSTNNVEGPLAGAGAVLVITMVVAAAGFPPFTIAEAMGFGLLVAPLAVAGQYLATAMLPHARAFAPALRRVDSLLLAAPVWYFGIEAVIT